MIANLRFCFFLLQTYLLIYKIKKKKLYRLKKKLKSRIII